MESDAQYVPETLQDSVDFESLKTELYSAKQTIFSVTYFFIPRVMPH